MRLASIIFGVVLGIYIWANKDAIGEWWSAKTPYACTTKTYSRYWGMECIIERTKGDLGDFIEDIGNEWENSENEIGNDSA